MIKKLQQIKENKVVSLIGKIIYIIFFVIVICMLAIVVFQRVTKNDASIMGYRVFTVATGSMLPKYEIGDMLIAKQVTPDTLVVGDDVVYKGKTGSFYNKMITHSIISINKDETNNVYKIVTKGLANTIEDPEITDDQVYGKIIYKVRSLSFLSKLISNPYVFYFIILIPIAISIVKRIIELKECYKDEEE